MPLVCVKSCCTHSKHPNKLLVAASHQLSSKSNLDGLPVISCDPCVLYARKNIDFSILSVLMISEEAVFMLRQVDRVMPAADRFPNDEMIYEMDHICFDVVLPESHQFHTW